MNDIPTPPSRARLRWILRFTALAAAIILAWPLFRADATLAYFPALSPFIGILSAIALRSAGVLTLLCLPALILALLTPRGFCRYACPTGLLQDLCGKLRPAAAQKWRPLPPLGHWALLLTIGGACLGYPFLLWLDPLAVFAAFVSALHQPLSGILVSAGLLLPLIVLLAIILPNAWCMRICPLGAAQELLALLRKPNPPPSRTDAGDALSGSPLPPEGEGLGVRGLAVRRRALFCGVLGAGIAFAQRKLGAKSTPPLRPPGAAEESAFVGACVRCGNCARACPAGIIHADSAANGIAGVLAPVLRFERDYCREDCSACGQVCPSGAIARLPLDQKRRQLIGLARIDLDTCLLANGRECTACIRQCPYGALTREDRDGGFSAIPALDKGKCNGCGACEAVCPVETVKAIRVVRKE